MASKNKALSIIHKSLRTSEWKLRPLWIQELMFSRIERTSPSSSNLKLVVSEILDKRNAETLAECHM